eukprot:Skav233166  [mRNA]  locus=scaffold1620:94393:96068:+ [translate_table: standard]
MSWQWFACERLRHELRLHCSAGFHRTAAVALLLAAILTVLWLAIRRSAMERIAWNHGMDVQGHQFFLKCFRWPPSLYGSGATPTGPRPPLYPPPAKKARPADRPATLVDDGSVEVLDEEGNDQEQEEEEPWEGDEEKEEEAQEEEAQEEEEAQDQDLEREEDVEEEDEEVVVGEPPASREAAFEMAAERQQRDKVMYRVGICHCKRSEYVMCMFAVSCESRQC